DRQGLELVGDEDVEGAVVVEIDEGDAARVRLRGPPEPRRDVDELRAAPVAAVEIDAVRLLPEDAVAAEVPPHVRVGVNLGSRAHELLVHVPVARTPGEALV